MQVIDLSLKSAIPFTLILTGAWTYPYAEREVFMEIVLPSHQARFIQDKVKMGAFTSPSQVITASLDLLIKQDQHQQLIQEGLADLDDGRTVPGDEVFRSLRQRFT